MDLTLGHEFGHAFGMGHFDRERSMMMREVTPLSGTPFSSFEALVASIMYSRLPGTQSPDIEDPGLSPVSPQDRGPLMVAEWIDWYREPIR